MKKIFFLVVTFFAFQVGTFAQSAELKGVFNDIKNTLLKYSIETEGVCKTGWYCYYTRSISASFNYPNLIITYTEGYRDGCVSGGESPGNHKLLVPITSTSFSKSDCWDKVRGYLEFENSVGIEHIYKGKSNLMTRTYFRADKLVVDKLCSQLKQFQKLLLSEGFRGSIGQMSSSSSKNVKDKSTNSAQKKSKSGIYGQ